MYVVSRDQRKTEPGWETGSWGLVGGRSSSLVEITRPRTRRRTRLRGDGQGEAASLLRAFGIWGWMDNEPWSGGGAAGAD